MNKYIKILLLIFLITGIAPVIRAQSKLQMKLGYSVNQPIGAFKNIINKTSFRGFDGGLMYSVSDQLGVGLGFSYSDFYQKTPRQVYQTGEGAISAVVINSIQVLPLVAKANYNLIKEGNVKPYVGIGAGVNLINYDQFLGEYANSNVSVKPAFTGDLGINIPLGISKRSGLNVGATFNYLPYNYNEIKNLNNWGVHAGLYFPLR